MRARFRTLTPPINLELLDMIEEGDRVAVRWRIDRHLRRQTFRTVDLGNLSFRGPHR
ncbi:MAG: nuclear transport factor 2 family protein [Stellaceae bacterium]